MNINQHSFIDYRRTIAANREIFLLKYPNILLDFLKTDDYCSALIVSLAKRRLPSGKTLVSFIPLIGLLQRQLRNSFEAFSAAQSYQGWVILRPALESALIMGKWSEDRKYCDLWMNRDKNRKEYAREYSGSKLESKNLPLSKEIRAVLSRINDDFMHLNEGYYMRHSSLDPINEEKFLYKVDYFDQDIVQDFHLHAFMHLSLLVIQCLSKMLDNEFKDGSSFTIDVEGFQKAYKETIKNLAKKEPRSHKGAYRIRVMAEPSNALDSQGGAALADWLSALPCLLMISPLAVCTYNAVLSFLSILVLF